MESLDLPNIFICGPSGSGKSTCIRNLDPEKTVIINTEGKRMPFKTVFKLQSKPKTWEKFISHVERALNSTAEVVVIDSFSSAVSMLYEHAVRYKDRSESRESWDNYKNAITDFLNMIKRPEKVVVVTGLEETIQDDQMRIIMTIAVQGKWKGEVASQFEMVLWTQGDDEGNHTFLTNTNGRCPAKSPDGMLDRVIPNDINAVIDAMMIFYGYANEPTTESNAE